MSHALILMLLLLPCSARADGGAHYFTAVQNGAYNFKGGQPGLEESYKALQGMVKLAGERGVRLTLLFSAQYAVYIASDAARLAELQGWKDAGHEIGAYHQGPETRGWDGYSDLEGKELARVRKSTGPLSAPGHAAFLAALSSLQPAIKTGCLIGSSDKKFLAAAPPYEICRRAAGSGAAAGVNEAVLTAPGGGPRKSLSSFHPADKAGIEAAQQAFAGMDRGVYGAVFRSTPAEFGAFYAWLTFLGRQDPQGLRSRTVSTVLAGALLPERKAPPRAEAVKPEKKQLPGVKAVQAAQEQAAPAEEIPKLKPVRGFYGQVGSLIPGHRRNLRPSRRCGDGICDMFERAAPGRCPRDCGQ